MANSLMSSRPYTLLRQALPSSLLHLSNRHFVSSTSVVLLSNKEINSLSSCINNNISSRSTKLIHIRSYGSKLASKLRFGEVGNRRFIAGATNVNDAGSIDSPLMQSMEKKIKEQLNAESVSVKDAYGDGRHVSIDVVSSAFEGQSAVNRQRMVYKAIWEELQSTVHAVDQMTTKTPNEAAAQK